MVRDLTVLAAVVGALIALLSLLINQRHARTGFEDALAREYRDIARTLPISALLGLPGPESGTPEFDDLLPAFYRYFDLSNEQAFLAKSKRVRADTWSEWKDGITNNLRKPQFGAAWLYVAEYATKLDEFEAIERIWTEAGLAHRHAPTSEPEGTTNDIS